MAVYGKGKLDFASIAADAFGSALGNGLVNQINDRHSADLWQRQLGEHLDEQRYEQRDFEDRLNDQAHAGYLAERQRDIADRLNDAAHAGYLASRQRDIADSLNDQAHAGYLAGVRAKAAEQRAAQAARLGQATDRNSHRAAELSQQAQATRVENQMRITSDRLPDYGVMHPRLKGATLPVGQVSERFNAFRKELEARSAVDPNNLVHLYERIVSEQKNIGSRTDLLAPTESLRLTSMEAYVRGYANLKGIQLPSEAEFYGGMQALGTPVGDAGAPPYGARRITPASLRNNGGVTNGVRGNSVGAESAINAARLRAQLMSKEIAGGHAFEKHVVGVGNPHGAEFAGLGIRTRQQFAQHVETVVNRPTHSGHLRNGREYFYDLNSNTIVIRNPKAADGGTAFRIDTKRYPDPTDYLKKNTEVRNVRSEQGSRRVRLKYGEGMPSGVCGGRFLSGLGVRNIVWGKPRDSAYCLQ